MIKKGDFKKERMFAGLDKIPRSDTLNELAGMDFADYGDSATSPHIHDTFSRFSAIVFLGAKKKEEQTAEMAGGVISDWVAVFGTPEIMMVGKDSRFIGGVFRISAWRVI